MLYDVVWFARISVSAISSATLSHLLLEKLIQKLLLLAFIASTESPYFASFES